jgi:hypothetical protein
VTIYIYIYITNVQPLVLPCAALEKSWLIYGYFGIIEETIAYCLYLSLHLSFLLARLIYGYFNHCCTCTCAAIFVGLIHYCFCTCSFTFNFVCWVSIIYCYSIPLTFFPYLNRIKKKKKKKERNKSISAKELFRIFEEAEGRLRLNMKQDFRKKI